MKKSLIAAAAGAWLMAGTAFAGVMDHDPKSLGGTMGRASGGGRADGVMSNPALLGSQRVPYGMLQLFPFSQLGVRYWSEELTLPALSNYASVDAFARMNELFRSIVQESMGVEGLGDSAAIASVQERFAEGARVVGGGRISIVNFTAGRVGIGLGATAVTDLLLPEAALVSIADDSLNVDLTVYDFTRFRQKTLATSDIGFALGIPLPSTRLNDFLRLPKWAAGARVSGILGMSYVDNAAVADTIGGWLCRGRSATLGGGYAVDAGVLLYGERAGFSLQVEDVGTVYWSGRDQDYLVTHDDIRNSTYGPPKDGGTPVSFVTSEPTALSASYSYRWAASRTAPKILHVLANSLYGAAGFRYQFVDYPGTKTGPVITLGVADGLLGGILPVRAGWQFGGLEKRASALGAGFDFRNYGVDLSYKALGSSVLDPAHGFEVSLAYSYVWRLDRDWDNDRVIDREDLCPLVPEDRDGFEDDDGCPDLDNDGDGIPDTEDSCMNVPEDRDGFEDDDGCPDPDNDGDGIPDEADSCPDEPEDINGFQDEDGCPDADNEVEVIPDTVAASPDEPETFEEHGSKDGYADEKESPIPPRASVAMFTIEDTMAFASGSTELTPPMREALDSIAWLFAKHTKMHFQVSGYADSRGNPDYNLRLSIRRAHAVRDYLVGRGVPPSRLVAVGYGSAFPVALNSTAAGRSANRRVTFSFVGVRQTFEKFQAIERDQEEILRRKE